MKNPTLFLLTSVLSLLACQKQDTPKIEAPDAERSRPWTNLQLNNSPENFQFMIVTDRTGGHRRGVFEQAVGKINLLQPEFVMSVGDLLEGYTEDVAAIERQWREFENFVGKLEMPFFFLAGNHDYSNEVMGEKWNLRFGGAYYHFRYQDVLFLCMNSEANFPVTTKEPHLTEEQMIYFEKTLKENRDVRWTLIFLHRPLWNVQNSGWGEFEKNLADRPYTVYSGHMHKYLKEVRRRMNYFTLATTGGGSSLRGSTYGEFDHVAWITMTDEGPIMANLLLDGIFDENVRTPEIVTLVERQPVRIEPIVIESEVFVGGAIARFRLENDLDVPFKVEAQIAAHPRLSFARTSFEKEVPPNSVEFVNISLSNKTPASIEELGTAQADFKLTCTLPENPEFTLNLKKSLGFDVKRLVRRAKSKPSVDGLLDDWPNLPHACERPMQLQFFPENYTGAEDCRFLFGVQHDDDFLYIAVKVFDDAAMYDPAKFPWHQDGVEIRLDARPEATSAYAQGSGEMKDILLIGLAPPRDEGNMVLYRPDLLPKGVQAVTVKTSFGHQSEIAVPISYLNEQQGEAWRSFRLNIAVDDYDSANDSGVQLWWRPDWRTFETYAGSGMFYREN